MRNILVLGFVSVCFLTGCGAGDQEFYRSAMMNGEVIATTQGSYGTQISTVKYQNKLYQCYSGGMPFCREV